MTGWLRLQVSLALALRKWDSVAYPWRCLFWDSADLERIEAGNSKNRASGKTATTTTPYPPHPPPPPNPPRPLGDIPVARGQPGKDATGLRPEPGLQHTGWDGAGHVWEGPKPSWGRKPAQGILYLLPFLQLGLGSLLRVINLTQSLVPRSFPAKGAIGRWPQEAQDFIG